MRNNENCRSVKTAPIVIKGGHWCDGLIPQLEVDGCWLDVRQCAARGIALKEQRRVEADRVTMHLELVNSGAGFRCGGFRWRYRRAAAGGPGLQAEPGLCPLCSLPPGVL